MKSVPLTHDYIKNGHFEKSFEKLIKDELIKTDNYNRH